MDVEQHQVPGFEPITETTTYSFWDEPNLKPYSYDSQIELDMLNVLVGMAARKYNTDIAAVLGLPPQYVELIQYMFCSVGWAEYGTSPRGAWLLHGREHEFIKKFRQHIHNQWEASQEERDLAWMQEG